MPNTGEHVRRAAQNLRFAQSFDLEKTPYIDWAVAAYFYAALHLVDALLFAKERINPPNHEKRRELVKFKTYLSGIKNEYRELKDRSEDARYDLLTFTKGKVEQNVIPLYDSIEQHILQQLPPEDVAEYEWRTRPAVEGPVKSGVERLRERLSERKKK